MSWAGRLRSASAIALLGRRHDLRRCVAPDRRCACTHDDLPVSFQRRRALSARTLSLALPGDPSLTGIKDPCPAAPLRTGDGATRRLATGLRAVCCRASRSAVAASRMMKAVIRQARLADRHVRGCLMSGRERLPSPRRQQVCAARASIEARTPAMQPASTAPPSLHAAVHPAVSPQPHAGRFAVGIAVQRPFATAVAAAIRQGEQP
jgi:hypothetical protein